MSKCCAARLARMTSVALWSLTFCAAAQQTIPAGPTPAMDPALRLARTTKLFDDLIAEYDHLLLRSKDRFSRSLIIVCLARVPRADATARLLQMAANENDPLVRMVAWQALLARAPM